MSKNFIESIKPDSCPYCYSHKVSSVRGGFQCRDCGERWSEEDSNFAQGMMPDDNDETEAAVFRKTKGSEDIDE